ncbi:MAG: hypothetical protein J0I84_18295 [Terrimonas sp.]|nr:hypothetical protein [Terrimonas sp.]OJY98257.1 MAG: hypothetical protein BGP13_11475 [Sphingobacteriales bacterium 40-81]
MKVLIAVIFPLITNLCFAQNIYKNQSLGFDIKQPENWIVAKDGQTLENLKEQIKLDSKTLDKLIENNKGTIQIVSFYKYPIESTHGIIPTIKVNLRKNSTKSFEEFKRSIVESYSSIKQIFPDFKFLTDPTKAKISGLDCVKATSSYTLKAHTGEEKVTITVYAVPVKDKFYQITFMDSENEDNTELYNKLAETILIY